MLALVLLFSSAFNPVETGLKEGKQAPMLKLKNSEGPRNRQKRNRKH